MFWARRRVRCIRRASPVVLMVVLIILYWIEIPSLRNINGVQNKDRYFERSTKATSDSWASPGTAKKQILLVTYGRSGSTYTSALISHQEGVFFVYEPLYALNKSVSRPNNEKDSMAIVKAFLNCDFTAQNTFALLNRHHINQMFTNKWYLCMQSSVNGGARVSCFLKMLAECRRSQVTFIKTIRFQVKWAESLLAGNPHFKLLFLVRDPRATLFSQAHVFRNFNQSTQIYISQQHCSRLALDLQDAERLHKLYPGQVKGIRYEHGATDALSYAKDIYNFLGLSFDDDLVDYIKNITNAPINATNVDRYFSVIRHNSTQTMNKWRFNAAFNSVQEIDTSCAHLYSKLGYQPILFKTHLQSQKSLVLSPDPGGIF